MERIKWRRMSLALARYGDEIVELMKNELQRHGKVATGELINTMKSYTEQEDDKQYLYVDFKDYGVYVDSGRRPGQKRPPLQAIREWIDVRGINPQGITKDQLSFLIQRKIGIRGIDPSPFIYLFTEHIDELNDMIADSSREDLEETINEYIKEFNRNNI